MKKNKISIFLLLFFCMLFFSNTYAYAASPSPSTQKLSEDELEFLKNKKVIKVSILIDWKPFSYVQKDGSYHGLPELILEKLSESSGITVEYVPAKSYEQSIEQLFAGEVDMIGMLNQYPNHEQYTPDGTTIELLAYLTSQTVLIRHKNTDLSSLPVTTLADVKGHLAFTNNPNVSILYYSDPKACLNAVRCGQTDTMLCDIFTASTLLHRYNAKDLLFLPTTIMLNTGLGVLPETDSRLISSLQKTIESIPSGEITRILMDGSDYKANGLLEIVYRYPFEIICCTIAIMFVIILILTTYNKVRIHQHQALRGYEESYRMLSDTFGEAGMEYDYLQDTLTIFGQHSTLDMNQTTTNFIEKLKAGEIRISLTAEMFEQIINDGMENKAFSTEFQCGVKSGEWVWYQLIYTVICTTESHRRPIRLIGCLANNNNAHAEKERLLKLSSNDQLTELLNHATGEKQVRSLVDQEENSRSGVLIVLDIDYFKQFNDQHGHLCGDKVLRSLGEAAREIFSSSNILCRWGGDEFLFFLTHNENDSTTLTTRLELLRQKMKNFHYQGKACPASLSIGGARIYPGCTFEILFQQADDALYLAKKNGRDQFWLYAPIEQTPTTCGKEVDYAAKIF